MCYKFNILLSTTLACHLQQVRCSNLALRSKHRKEVINIAYRKKTCLVRCLKGTSKTAKHKNWLKYWEDKTGDKAGTCSICDCSEPATDGAHVICCGDKTHYIIPMCHKCNEEETSYHWATAKLVPEADA